MRVAFALMLSAAVAAAAEQRRDEPFLVPAPQHVSYQAGSLHLDNGAELVFDGTASPRMPEIAGLLQEGLQALGVNARLANDRSTPGIPVIRLAIRPLARSGPEGSYEIQVAEAVTLSAAEPVGLIWAVQTTLQAVQSAGGHKSIRKMDISDEPRFAWRGLMIDPVTVFIPVPYLQRLIREMSDYKLNILHLNLTDSNAWRMEIKGYPGCNPPHEPFYTQAELRELAAYAKRYGVEIVPEID